MNKQIITKYFKSLENYRLICKKISDKFNKENYILFDKKIVIQYLSQNNIKKLKVVSYENDKKSKQKIKSLDEISKFINELNDDSFDEILLNKKPLTWIFNKNNNVLSIFKNGCSSETNIYDTKIRELAKQFYDSKNKKDLKIAAEKKAAEIKAKEAERKERKVLREKQLAIAGGIYSMIDEASQERARFWRICTQAGGYESGELITIAYTNNVPSRPLFLDFFDELSTSLDVFNIKQPHDVLFLSGNKNSHNLIEQYSWINRRKTFVNNILNDVRDVKTIKDIVKKYKPKIIFIDNFQLLSGSEIKNVELLSEMCRQYNLCCFVLYELNDVNLKTKPDITKISKKSKITEKSDKVYIVWSLSQEWEQIWYPTDCDLLSFDLVKNRQGKTCTEYLYFGDSGAHSPSNDDLLEIYEKAKEFDEGIQKVNDISSAIEDVQSSIEQAAKKTETEKPFMVLKNGIII